MTTFRATLVKLLDPAHWLNRIVVIVALFAAAVVTVSTALQMVSGLPNDLFQAIAMLTIWSCACCIVLADELRQPGGNLVATGIMPTSKTPALFARGAVWGAAMLGIIAITGLILGSRFESQALRLGPLSVLNIAAGAIGEELLFRTTLLRVLRDRFGASWSVMLTSAVFAAAHVGNPGASDISTINTFLVALVLASVVIRSGSIWIAAGFHVTWNLFVALCFGSVSGYDTGLAWMRLSVDGASGVSQLMLGGAYGIESGLACTFSIIISFAFLRHISLADPYVIAARYRNSFSRRHSTADSSTNMETTHVG